MKKYLIASVLFFATLVANAQNCSCESNFEWVKKTFEENDAGYEYIIDKKGKQAYEDHNKRVLEDIKKAKNLEECASILYDWLEFFRSGHISISLLNQNHEKNTTNIIEEDFSNWEKLKVDVPKFKKYLDKKKKQDVEGIWYTEPYTIGIKKDGDSYLGFIIESGAETWKQNDVKLRLNFNLEKAIYYLRNHSEFVTNDVSMLGDNYLKIGNFYLKRILPKLPEDENIELYISSLQTKTPFLEKLNDKTLFLRIPSFRYENKASIDSVLLANKELILKTENLIIDIRNGTGGSDASFNELIPFLYTNPIRTVGVQYRSTKFNNQRMLDFINNPEYGFGKEEKEWANEAFIKLEQNLGKYVGLNPYDVNLQTLDTVYEFPKKVAIIINEGNGSTDEQFLLTAKQSQKVKLFGKTTFGVLDISNMYFLNSPCDEFKFGYALSRSKRIPDFIIDEIGIQPDYFMDSEIPNQNWIPFINDILNYK